MKDTVSKLRYKSLLLRLASQASNDMAVLFSSRVAVCCYAGWVLVTTQQQRREAFVDLPNRTTNILSTPFVPTISCSELWNIAVLFVPVYNIIHPSP